MLTLNVHGKEVGVLNDQLCVRGLNTRVINTKCEGTLRTPSELLTWVLTYELRHWFLVLSPGPWTMGVCVFHMYKSQECAPFCIHQG
jgi:hypothetical protein